MKGLCQSQSFPSAALISDTLPWFFFFFFFNVYLFLRERENVSRGGDRERETQNPKQASGSGLSSTQSPTRGSNSWASRSWPERSWTLNQLSHPGAPLPWFLVAFSSQNCHLWETTGLRLSSSSLCCGFNALVSKLEQSSPPNFLLSGITVLCCPFNIWKTVVSCILFRFLVL